MLNLRIGHTIVSKVLRKKVVLSMEFITKVTGCIREGSTYQEDWEKTYERHVLKALYRKNIKKKDGKKKVQYNLLCDMAKIWSNITQKSFMHKVGSKDSI